MRMISRVAIPALLLLSLAACATPARPTEPVPANGVAQDVAPRVTRTLVMAVGNEPEVLTAGDRHQRQPRHADPPLQRRGGPEGRPWYRAALPCRGTAPAQYG